MFLLNGKKKKSPKTKTLLILCRNQFGQHIDTYQYCKHLRERFNITYLCWDYGKKKQTMERVEIISVPRKGNIIFRNLRYIQESVRQLQKKQYDICFIKYFRGCSLLKLLFYKQLFVFDIRTSGIFKNRFIKNAYDVFMRFESRFFSHCTIISQSLAKQLGLTDRSTVLPLGSEIIADNKKKFEVMNLLYVGTFINRELEKTIVGFNKFFNKFHQKIPLSYTIIGDGNRGDGDKLKKLVRQLGLGEKIFFPGRIPFDELTPYFETHNIGVSFVPMTPYFDAQPVTKTFDYLLSGMPVIATATSENRLVVNKKNGVLIADSPDSFKKGLEEIYKQRHTYNSDYIVESSRKFSRKKIISEFGDYLENLLQHNCQSHEQGKKTKHVNR